ncbi:hypothetical protein DFH09DRAFT_1093227 [Mycena vulgaris]|nr:hypothetical protein DFH09DRAFT_1093227 [Mycena vulgaris]
MILQAGKTVIPVQIAFTRGHRVNLYADYAHQLWARIHIPELAIGDVHVYQIHTWWLALNTAVTDSVLASQKIGRGVSLAMQVEKLAIDLTLISERTRSAPRLGGAAVEHSNCHETATSPLIDRALYCSVVLFYYPGRDSVARLVFSGDELKISTNHLLWRRPAIHAWDLSPKFMLGGNIRGEKGTPPPQRCCHACPGNQKARTSSKNTSSTVGKVFSSAEKRSRYREFEVNTKRHVDIHACRYPKKQGARYAFHGQRVEKEVKRGKDRGTRLRLAEVYVTLDLQRAPWVDPDDFASFKKWKGYRESQACSGVGAGKLQAIVVVPLEGSGERTMTLQEIEAPPVTTALGDDSDRS